MIKVKKIKTEWASLILTSNKIPIICVESEKSLDCFCFKSLKQLEEVIKTKKIFVRKWALSLPRNLCILKEISLPASTIDEAYQMIEFELPSLVPMTLNELVYGCTILNKQENLLNISVCILKQEFLNRFLKEYKNIQIKPQKILLESLGLQNWFNVKAGFSSGLGIGICVNRSDCHILTFCDGCLREIKQLNLSAAEVSSRQIAQEVLSQTKQNPYSDLKEKKIAIVGVQEYTSEIKNLLSEESQNFDSYKIDVLPGPSVTYYKKEYPDDAPEDFSYETLIAAGLLKLTGEPKYKYSNLLPQSHLKKAHKKVLLFNYLITSSLSIILILFLWLSLVFMNWRIERQSMNIQSQIGPIEKIVGSIDSKRQRVQAIRRQLENHALVTRIFRELYYHTPSSISISELKFNLDAKGGYVDIKGQADSLSDAFGYTETVIKSELLHEMQITNAQQVPRAGGSIVEFRANCLIKNH